MHPIRRLSKVVLSSFLLTAATLTMPAQILWQVGMDDNGWPLNQDNPGDGGGPNATFIQENGGGGPAFPGFTDSPEINAQGDNEYYLEGTYTTAIQSVVDLYGTYTPVGVVDSNEE